MYKENKKNRKRIEELSNELKAIDEVQKKNKEQYKLQVQIGLYGKGYPQGSPMYDTLLDKMKLEVEGLQIQIDSGYKTTYPDFEFQRHPRWIEIQLEFARRNLKANQENIIEIEKNLAEVENAIAEQQIRIEARRTQILDELKSMKVDISEFKTPNYIG